MPISLPPNGDEPIRSRDDLLAVFVDAAGTGSLLIGPEVEKCGIRTADFGSVVYEREVIEVLHHLAKNGWKELRESETGPLIAVQKGSASVTLEPGGQLELSGAAAPDVHAIADELRGHMRELEAISARLGVAWLGIGFHPFGRREDLEWVPKARYATMREYFPKRGAFGIDMMLRTCTVQVNLDYSSEHDAMRKMRVGLRLAPLCAGLFANSPFVEGTPFGGLTMRARVWLDVDGTRSGLVPSLWSPDATFSDYIDWAIGAPMFILKREHRVITATDQTFAQFLAHGRDGHRATQADWQMHLNTLFPEVRLKRTIEIRSADSQGPATATALPALYTGLFYDEKALGEIEALTASWTYDEVMALREHVWESALKTPFRGAPLIKAAEAVLTIAKGGLARRARRDAKGQDENVHLAGLEALVARGMSPADDLLVRVGDTSDPKWKQRLVDATNLAQF